MCSSLLYSVLQKQISVVTLLLKKLHALYLQVSVYILTHSFKNLTADLVEHFYFPL